MKKGMNALVVAGLLLGHAAIASEKARLPSVIGDRYTREELKEALAILLDSGALTFPDAHNQCSKMDSQLLKELRAEGIIRGSGAEMATICTDIIE